MKKGRRVFTIIIFGIIAGILATIAVSLYTGYVEKARVKKAYSIIGATIISQKMEKQRTENFFSVPLVDSITDIPAFRTNGIDIRDTTFFTCETTATGVKPNGGFTVTATPRDAFATAGGTMMYTYDPTATPSGSWAADGVIILDDMLPTEPNSDAISGSGMSEYFFENPMLFCIVFFILLFLLIVYLRLFEIIDEDMPKIIAEDMRKRESRKHMEKNKFWKNEKRRLKESRLYNLTLNTSPELMKLIGDVILKIPEDQWAAIKGKKILIHQATGIVQKCGVYTNGWRWDYQLILAKDLEKDPDYAKFIIAHDFAHILLGYPDHPVPFDTKPKSEREGLSYKDQADKLAVMLAAKWGFLIKQENNQRWDC